MKKTFIIWASCFVLLILSMATLGIWGLDESTTKAIAFALGGASIFSVIIYIYASKQKYKNSVTELRNSPQNNGIKTIGSYNAYYFDGDTFKSMMLGEPAVLDFNEQCVMLKVLPDSPDPDETLTEKYYGKERLIEYKKEDSEVLWVGNSGRYKDYYTWLEIKDLSKASLVSIYVGQPHSLDYDTESKRCAAELFYKLTDLGYKTQIDSKKRGLFMDIFSVVVTLVLSIITIMSKNWLPAAISAVAFIVVISGLLFSKKGPPPRK
jgi:hypothetical protein